MLRAFSKKKMKKGNKHRQRIIEIEAMNKNFNGKSYVKDGIESDFQQFINTMQLTVLSLRKTHYEEISIYIWQNEPSYNWA